ncbi:MAG TPA: hypothetical protein VF787_29090 [Thermoanaerobaculia bacterium]
MQLDETTWKWLTIGTIAVAVVLYLTVSRLIERRRRALVDGLAQAFGATATHGSDATSRFYANVIDRRCEIAHGYHCRTADGRYARGYRLIVVVPLHGVSDIYNLSLKRVDGQRSAESLSVTISGYQPRDGWLTVALREAIFDFYDVAVDRGTLNLEAGALMFATNRRVDGPTLLDLVRRQLSVAANIERTL